MHRAGLVTLDLILGVTATAGGVMVVPTLPPEWLAGAPFADYTIPAAALTLTGVTALAGAVGLLARPKLGAVLSLIGGGAITVFEIVEVWAVNLGDWLAFFSISAGSRMPANSVSLALTLQVFYLVVGLAMMALAWSVWRTAGAAPMVDAPPTSSTAPSAPPVLAARRRSRLAA